jgi:hypothetical protein
MFSITPIYNNNYYKPILINKINNNVAQANTSSNLNTPYKEVISIIEDTKKEDEGNLEQQNKPLFRKLYPNNHRSLSIIGNNSTTSIKNPSRNQNINQPYNNKLSLTQNTFNKTFRNSITINTNSISDFKRASTLFQPKQIPNPKNAVIQKYNDMIRKRNTIVKKPKEYFEVSEEDKIFDTNAQDINNNIIKIYDNNNELNENIGENNIVGDLSPKLLKKSFFSPNKSDAFQRKLDKIYQLDVGFLTNLKTAKLKKKELDLEKYQTNLLKTIGKQFTRESVVKLHSKFIGLRRQAKKTCEKVSDYVREIENWEAEIIEKITRNEEKVEFLLHDAKIKSSLSPLPRIKFERVLK